LTITLRCCICLFFPQVFPFVFIFALKKAHTLISETKYAQAYLTVNAPVTFLKEPEDSHMTEGEFAECHQRKRIQRLSLRVLPGQPTAEDQ